MIKIKLRKSGKLFIPSHIRRMIAFKPDENIKIIMRGEKLLLTNEHGFKYENSSSMHNDGTIYIPTEVRKLSKMDINTNFYIESLDETKVILQIRK